MISIRGIEKAFGHNSVLRGIDLDVQKGEIVTMIGPSGAGKTTLLRTLNWLDVPDAGTITIDGVTVDAARATKRDVRLLRSKTAMVFQHYHEMLLAIRRHREISPRACLHDGVNVCPAACRCQEFLSGSLMADKLKYEAPQEPGIQS